jgi:Tol biopolymer transport system component
MSEGAAQGAPIPVLQQFDGGPVGFTPDGAFYYSTSRSVSDIYLADLTQPDASLKPGLASQRFVGRTGGGNWSDDGKTLAYSTDTNSGVIGDRGPKAWGLVLLSVDTGKERLVMPSYPIWGTWHGCIPRWSQDGKSVLILGESEEHGSGPYLVNITTGKAKFIDSIPCNVNSQIAWNQTGNCLFVCTKAGPSQPTRILRFDLSTQSSQELASWPWGARGFDLSADGQWLAFWQEESRLVILPTTGGEPRVVLNTSEVQGEDCFVRWSPDGQSLFFPKRRSELWRVDIATGQEQSTGLKRKQLSDVAVHPQGNTLALTVRQPGYQLWALEDFLP